MNYTVVSRRVYQNLQELLANSGLKGITPKSVERLLAMSIAGAVAEPASKAPFTDTETGLLLPPPPPEEIYGGHWHRLGRRLDAESFLARYWSEYAQKDRPMLYAAHLRMHDLSLLDALKNQARANGEDVDSWLLQRGVVSLKFALSPRPRFARQAMIFRSLTVSNRASSTLDRNAIVHTQDDVRDI